MADNVTANAGAGGPVFATDEVGGAHHPYTKLEYGADGTATKVSSSDPLPTSNLPGTSGGLTPHRTIAAASTNATSVKASAGQIYGLFVSNVNASPRYLKLYNKASAPTVGTDTPVLTLLIPGNSNGGGLTIQQPLGIAFATGIAFALTTGVADNDTGAVAASELVVNLLYK